MPAFLDIRFPDNIAVGSEFGPRWNTDVIRTGGGFEYRTQSWSHPLYAGDVAFGIRAPEDIDQLIQFFHMARGRVYGFRFKDWSDYRVESEDITTNGGPQYELAKRYGDGTNDYIRPITKPVPGTVTMTRSGSQFSAFSVDYSEGRITLDPDSVSSIANIAQDGAGTVTSEAHGFSTGDWIYIDGVGGMDGVNGQPYPITVLGVDTFTLGVSTSGMDAYTGGGTASYYVQPGEVLTWSGEFDVPCRFDADSISRIWEDYESQSASVPVTEIRV